MPTKKSSSSSRVLTDREQIRSWAEERGAKPAAVRSTESDNDVGIIRLDFPGYSGGNSLEEIEWDNWFEKFEDSNLALIVQDQTANGESSNFNKLVSRDTVETEDSGSKPSTGASSRNGSRRASSNSNSKAAGRGASSSGRSASGSSSKRASSGRASAQTGSAKKKSASNAASSKRSSAKSSSARRSSAKGPAKRTSAKSAPVKAKARGTSGRGKSSGGRKAA